MDQEGDGCRNHQGATGKKNPLSSGKRRVTDVKPSLAREDYRAHDLGVQVVQSAMSRDTEVSRIEDDLGRGRGCAKSSVQLEEGEGEEGGAAKVGKYWSE